MKPDQLVSALRPYCKFAGVILVVASLAKMTGIVQVKFGIMEMIPIAIACLLV